METTVDKHNILMLLLNNYILFGFAHLDTLYDLKRIIGSCFKYGWEVNSKEKLEGKIFFSF